jgi:hypothetical protein
VYPVLSNQRQTTLLCASRNIQTAAVEMLKTRSRLPQTPS